MCFSSLYFIFTLDFLELDSPKNLVTDQVTEDSATISWDSVQAPIDRYIVSYTSADGGTKEIEVGKAESITTLTGLKAGMKYAIHLWAELGSMQSKRASTDALTGNCGERRSRVEEPHSFVNLHFHDLSLHHWIMKIYCGKYVLEISA